MRGGRFDSSRGQESDGLDVRVVQTNKVSKTHKGGRTMSWSVLVVVGDGQGRVGAAIGKARGVPDAIRKGEDAARKSMIRVPMVDRTIPHRIIGQEGSTRVLLQPASEGTGVVAGGAVRSILEAAGIHDVLAKTLGSRNAVNCAWAALNALEQLTDPKERAAQRSLELKDIAPWFTKESKEEAHEVASEVG
ncbi:MAG: 30S ribosomal protein S5 [Fimbriimonadales bacterium]|nr:MAG: 30S ribosomal protein S5 [Armatimonadota bacterium]MBV6502656.1 30S ribosomal protein S5 [Fimbriimonadales bacterium]MCE7898497.1 30S ribosomal protein S5 [Armatimonadetes bacterium ATM1]MDL1928210.1 30S ribosomal protein S5 [Fimbriimonadia bacterium ATM]MBC6968664.1 30S ribosomal protein S5 [Armatimonadota bacterium]